MNKKRLLDYQEQLLIKLQDEKFAAAYLNEALQDEDPRMFLLALKNVIDAQQNDLAAVAQEANLSRMSLYRILSKKSNPKLTSIVSLLSAVGLQLSVHPSVGNKTARKN